MGRVESGLVSADAAGSVEEMSNWRQARKEAKVFDEKA